MRKRKEKGHPEKGVLFLWEKMMDTDIKKKIEICSSNGYTLQIEMTFAELMATLENSIVRPDDFVYLPLPDGCRTAIRKKDIMMVSEYYEDSEERNGDPDIS